MRRNLPVWFNNGGRKKDDESGTVDHINNDVTNQPSTQSSEDFKTILQSHNSRSGRILRSSSYKGSYEENKVLDRYNPIEYPPIIYKGKINYCTTMMDIAFSSDQLL